MPSRRAFTLIELVIVIAIIGIMAAIGVGTVRDLIPRSRMVGASKALHQDLMQLRVTAGSMNRETRLLVVEADPAYDDWQTEAIGEYYLQVGDKPRNSTSWDTLPADAQEDGTDDDQGLGIVDIPGARPGVSLVPTGLSGDAVVFSPRGFVSNGDADFGSDGYITLTVVNKSSFQENIEDSVSLKISRTGNVTMVSSLGKQDAGNVGSASKSSAGGT